MIDREHEPPREKYPTYSRPDSELLEIRSPFALSPGIPKFVYKPPIEGESLSPLQKEKYRLAKELTSDTHTIKLKGKKDERNQSKEVKKKPKKIHSRAK